MIPQFTNTARQVSMRLVGETRDLAFTSGATGGIDPPNGCEATCRHAGRAHCGHPGADPETQKSQREQLRAKFSRQNARPKMPLRAGP